jgi:hypothetical protein
MMQIFVISASVSFILLPFLFCMLMSNLRITKVSA